MLGTTTGDLPTQHRLALSGKCLIADYVKKEMLIPVPLKLRDVSLPVRYGIDGMGRS